MKREHLLAKIEELAERLCFVIRYENLGHVRGGNCRLHDEKYLFVNKSLSISSQIDTIAQALAAVNLEGIYILPEIRQRLLRFQKPLANPHENDVQDATQ